MSSSASSTSIQSTSTSAPVGTSSSATAGPTQTNTKAASHIGVEVGVPVGVVAVAALGGIIAWILLRKKRASKGSALPQDDMHGGGTPPYTDQSAGGYVQKPMLFQEMDAQKPAAHELIGNGYYAPVELPAEQR
jgi:hypothetical protein